MDLSPFGAIDPCGYPGLQVTQMKDLGFSLSKDLLASKLKDCLIRNIEHA
jgi:lipoyl(octanoyl) transferase